MALSAAQAMSYGPFSARACIIILICAPLSIVTRSGPPGAPAVVAVAQRETKPCVRTFPPPESKQGATCPRSRGRVRLVVRVVVAEALRALPHLRGPPPAPRSTSPFSAAFRFRCP